MKLRPVSLKKVIILTRSVFTRKKFERRSNRDKYSMAETPISHLRSKSVLHYWLQLSQEPTQDFIRLFDYLSERDLGLLEIALSELDLRKFYKQSLHNHFKTHQIVIAKINRSKSHLDWILKRGLNNDITKLVISYNESDEYMNSDVYDLRLPKLLDIRFWFISPKLCSALSLYSPNLQKLKILSRSNEIFLESIEALCSGCPKLKYIQIFEDIDRDDSISLYGSILEPICKHCKELEVLKLNWLCDVYPDHIARLSQLTHLAMLVIDFFEWPCSPDEVFASNTMLETVVLCGGLSHDTVMKGLGAHCHSLKRVSLSSQAQMITDEGIIAMVQGCPQLEKIDIRASKKTFESPYNHKSVSTVAVTNTSLYAIARHCPNLISLELSIPEPQAYDNTGLDAIKHSCPHLQVINKDDDEYYAAPGYDEDCVMLYDYYSDDDY